MELNKRDYWIAIGAVFVAFVLALGLLADRAVTAGAWGLHFSSEGKTPSGPASARQLQALGAAYVDERGEKVLYLTFDAGYENGYTGKILDVLKSHQVSATFFLVGNYLEKNGDLVRRMVEEGHTVGNHTMHHPDMRKLSDPAAFQKELEELESLYTAVTGKTMEKYYRPPQGLYSEENLKAAQDLGYKTVFWSLAYADWDNKAQPSTKTALDKLLGRTHDGAVILLHSTSQTNAQVLDELLTRWEEMGYRFAPISELFD